MADIEHQPVQDLSGPAAIDKLKTLAEHSRTCLFSTDVNTHPSDITPMSLQDVDDNATLWFISGRNSTRNANIAQDPRVALTFQNEGKAEYMALHGVARIFDDRATIDAHWTKLADAWFEQGKDDPNVTIIGVTIDGGHYWETKHGKVAAFTQMAFAAFTGTDVDDGGREGDLSPDPRLHRL